MQLKNISIEQRRLAKRSKPVKVRRKSTKFTRREMLEVRGVDGRPIVQNPVVNFTKLLADNLLSMLLEADGYRLYNNMQTGELIVTCGKETHSLDKTIYNYRRMYGYSDREDIHGSRGKQLKLSALTEGIGVLGGYGIYASSR